MAITAVMSLPATFCWIRMLMRLSVHSNSLTNHRKPSHSLLNSFISHMGQGGRGHWESPLSSVPRLPNHSACEMGELTQTGRPGTSHYKDQTFFFWSLIKTWTFLSFHVLSQALEPCVILDNLLTEPSNQPFVKYYCHANSCKSWHRLFLQVWCSTCAMGSYSTKPTSATISSPPIGRPARCGWRPQVRAALFRVDWPSSMVSSQTLIGRSWPCITSGVHCSAARPATAPPGTDTWRRSRGGSIGSEWPIQNWRGLTPIWRALWVCPPVSSELQTLLTLCCATCATAFLSRAFPWQILVAAGVWQWHSLLWFVGSS